MNREVAIGGCVVVQHPPTNNSAKFTKSIEDIK